MSIHPDQEAYAETLQYNGTIWDAVFVTHSDGSRELKALTASAAMADFIAQALNDARTSGRLKTG